MIRESTLRRNIEVGNHAAVRQAFQRSARKLIEDGNLYSDIRSNYFTSMHISVPRDGVKGNVKVSFTTSANPFSDPGTFFNRYAGKDSTVVKTIPKAKLILWGK